MKHKIRFKRVIAYVLSGIMAVSGLSPALLNAYKAQAADKTIR